MSGDDPEITKRKIERKTKEAAANAAAATIADRLTNRARDQVVNVSLQDDAGDIKIPMRIPSLGITYDLSQIETLMTNQQGQEKLATLMSELSLDPSLDYEFWLKGPIGLVDFRLIVEGLTEASVTRMQDVQSFRKE
ncbi:MAG: hypothetical protein HF975_04490 [ANME-2 cluster archaeon]|nr:hypothetical protein [ANME-2 cluster archaeon]